MTSWVTSLATWPRITSGNSCQTRNDQQLDVQQSCSVTIVLIVIITTRWRWVASRRSSLATYYTQLLQSITHSPSACVRPSHTDKCVQPRRRDETCLCAQFCLSAERSTLVAQTLSLHVVFCKKKYTKCWHVSNAFVFSWAKSCS